ncbi:MAG: DNA polymerase domain-containing protein [Candidatus Hodarchaeales archaeon]|jgi:DNA polymerase elongation subunit (family B)
MPKHLAWLHDISVADWGVNTYWITSGKGVRAFYPLTAEWFLTKTDQETRKQILSHPEVESIEEVSKYKSIHEWKLSPVLRIKVNPAKLQGTFEDLRKYWGDYLFNADLSLFQQFCFQTGLFPYVYAKIDVQNGRLQNNWQLLEQYLQAEYRPVPFQTLWMQPMFTDRNFSRGKIKEIHFRHTLEQDEEPVVFANKSEGTTIRESIAYLNHSDPDILFTSGGDTFLPVLASHATNQGLGYLKLGRGSRKLYSYVRKKQKPRGHSYMSYGRIFFSQHGVYPDGGRHHYDVGNSFMWKDGNIEGIHELVRLGCSDPQRIARGTIGTTLTAVQMRTAYQRNILIPARKGDCENFRKAWTMMSDVGGLVFSPRVGFHKNLVELDFLSMYPSIMVYRNVSPDTVNCGCCKNEQKQIVPETDHHVCTQRPGLVSLALQNILDRRAYFKSKRKEHSRYDKKQKVLKWLLVCCFEPNTIVPVKEKDKLNLVRIGPYIDKLIENSTDLNEVSLIGVDRNFKTFFNSVKNIFRVNKANLMLYNIKLETGREFTVTGDHLCYTLRNGKLLEQKADTLIPGDFIPVMLKSPEVKPVVEIDTIEPLLDIVTYEDLDNWRIQGEKLSHYLINRKSQLRKTMTEHHHEASFKVWKRSNFIPLRYFKRLNVPKKEWSSLKIGRGRRGGGRIQWIPSSYTLDSDLAFFLGYFIGDGSARETYIRLSVHGDDLDLNNWFSDFFLCRFGLKVHIRKEKHTHMFTLQINSIALVQVLKILDVERTRATGKLKVPSPILNGTNDTIYGFFSGLVASDGNVHPDRNQIRISSCEKQFIEELNYLATRIGLYTTISSAKKDSIHNIDISGEKNLQKLVKFGKIKIFDLRKIHRKENKIRSRALIEDLPIIESGLSLLAQKARTIRKPRLSGIERTSRENVKTQIQQIAQKQRKLSSVDNKQLDVIEKLVNGDIGFGKITEIAPVQSDCQYVYCFEVTKEFPGFIAGTGGIFSHNSFGYQGYRNARFGRIEAHEAISAYGREALTRTNQIASDYGLEVVAGIVDSIWLKNPDETPIEPSLIQKVIHRVENEVKLPLEHSADYHWLVFLPRRHEPTIGVLNRYYGLKTDLKYKIRGIEIRQSSAPAFVKKLQLKLLDVLSSARTHEEFKKYSIKAKQIMQSYLADLQAGNIPLKDLLVTIRPSRGPDEYVSNTRQALASRQLAAAGVKVEAGVKLSYLILDADASDPAKRVKVSQLLTGKERYDYQEYRKLCIRAFEGLIPPEMEIKKKLVIDQFLV